LESGFSFKISYICTLYILRAEGLLGFRILISQHNHLYTVINVCMNEL